jgi:hypothetical protein
MNAATFLFLALPLLAPMFLSAGATLNPPLTVLMDFEAPHSEASLTALRGSLDRILSPGGIVVDVQLRADLPKNPQFGELVVFKMKGSCSMSSRPLPTAPDELGPLAMAYTSDGEVLHFGEVQCDRVRRSLQRVLGFNSSLKSQQTYGSALAVVIAHEVYHMLGNVREHTQKGITKAELSASELMDSNVTLPAGIIPSVQKYLLAP